MLTWDSHISCLSWCKYSQKLFSFLKVAITLILFPNKLTTSLMSFPINTLLLFTLFTLHVYQHNTSKLRFSKLLITIQHGNYNLLSFRILSIIISYHLLKPTHSTSLSLINISTIITLQIIIQHNYCFLNLNKTIFK
jgi:hypothetical protein